MSVATITPSPPTTSIAKQTFSAAAAVAPTLHVHRVGAGEPPDAKLIYLPGLNHVPISDDPTAVAHHMLRFLGQITPRAVTAS